MSTPVKVIEVDLKDVQLQISNEGIYQDAFVLVRCGPHVLNSLKLTFKDGLITREDIMMADHHRPGHQLIIDDLKRFTGIPMIEATFDLPISVVVCTRNRTNMLVHCLSALKTQQYGRYEIIVVDNAPDDDGTKKLASLMGVRYVREEKPGLDRARNMGIREARYDIVAFTDDDAKADKYWLQSIAKGFKDATVMAVTGYVAPAEMETRAQQMFEWAYGGMGHGFERKVYDGSRMRDREKLGAGGFGVGANMAFRKEWFDIGGYFDHALDVGTPSFGGGDIEMFHRVVATGNKLVYEPGMLVWHTHRRSMEELHQQVFNNGRSFVCYLLTCFRNGTADVGTVIVFFMKNWLYQWHIRNIFFGKGTVSRSLLMSELKGMLRGPAAYARSRRYTKQLDA